METAFDACQTMRRAMGFTAGPDKPPVMFPKIGRRVVMSMAMPVRVLMRERASAPAASTALAMVVISVTLGDNLTITGFFVLSLTLRVTAAAASGWVPKTMPPSLTLGQEILTSRPATPSTSRSAAICPYSSTLPAETLTMSGVLQAAPTLGRISLLKASTPGFSRPMQLSIPAGVSATRTPGLPGRGKGVMPLEMMAPTASRSRKSAYSMPNPKVPDAPITGVFMEMPANSTAIRSLIIRKPPLPKRQDRRYRLYSAYRPVCFQRYSPGRHRCRRPSVFP